MRKFLLIAVLSMFFTIIQAQEKYPVYCDVYLIGERDFGKNAVLNFDFGLDRNVNLLDENGKTIKFPSVIAAINYLAKKGWKLFTVGMGTNSAASVLSETITGMKTILLPMHYVMVKEVSSDDEILIGLRTSKEERKKKEMSDDGYLY